MLRTGLLCERRSGSEKRLNARLRATEYQRVDIVRAFIRIHHFEVDEMPRDAEFIRDAVAAEHVAREPRDVQRLAT